MKKITLWLKALWHWLGEARHTWIGGGGIVFVIALVFALQPGTGEPVTTIVERSLRLSGMVLQLLGIITVVWGIKETRKLFGRPSIRDAISQWIRRFPVYGGRSINATAAVVLDSLTSSGRLSIKAVAKPDASMVERVEVLEKNIAIINERIDGTQHEMDQMKSEAQSTLKREEQARFSSDSEIMTKLETTETGGLTISAIGAVWLFVGVILSSSSVELAHFLH